MPKLRLDRPSSEYLSETKFIAANAVGASNAPPISLFEQSGMALLWFARTYGAERCAPTYRHEPPVAGIEDLRFFAESLVYGHEATMPAQLGRDLLHMLGEYEAILERQKIAKETEEEKPSTQWRSLSNALRIQTQLFGGLPRRSLKPKKMLRVGYKAPRAKRKGFL